MIFSSFSQQNISVQRVQLFLDLCDFLGVPTAPEKTFGPSTILTFAGVELDTIHCESRLPEDKLLKCKHLITKFMRKKKATLRELQSLIGLLNFACSVVVPGRSFLRRLIDLTTGLQRPSHLMFVFLRRLRLICLFGNNFFKSIMANPFFLMNDGIIV